MTSPARKDNSGAVASLARTANLEIIPLRGVEQKLTVIPAATTVTITCSPKFGLGRTLEHTTAAAQAGYRVVPHLAARQVADEAELRGFIGRLDELGVKDLYVVGGDSAEPAGRYSSTAELLSALANIDHGVERIGVACYPEGHPKIPDDALNEALHEKQPQVDYMVSQLCFDVDALLGWLRETRSQGIRLPLHLGVAAPMNTRKLVELSVKIGVGSSIRYLTKQHGFVTNLLRGSAYRPEDLLHEIGDDLSSEELGIQRLHLFSFNQIDATVDWQRRTGGPAEPAAV